MGILLPGGGDRLRKAPILILVCWIVFGFLLYLGYGEVYELPQIDLPTEYAYLPEALSTQTSTIAFVISGLVLGLVSYAVIFPSNRTYSPRVAHDEVSPQLSKSIDSMIKKYGIKTTTRFPKINRLQREKMGVAIIDGVTIYSRRFTQSPAMLERIASEYTVAEAWALLRTDFWDTKRRTLKRFNPEIYEQIVYWENHLDEYFVYMNMKRLFNLPCLEQDFWVRRGRE